MVLNSQLSQQRKDQLVGSTKLVFRIGLPQIVQSVNKVQVGQELKSLASGSNLEHKRKNSGASVSYGLLWKKKKSDEAGKDFRLENVILKLKDGMSPSMEPSCCLCKRPYRPDLMYICCERCKSWYHADALQVEEAQIFDLVGFKCCKCRRKGSPKCPYADPHYKKPEPEPSSNGNANQANKFNNLDHSTMLRSLPRGEDLVITDDDPLLSSSERVESFARQTPETELQLHTPMSTSQSHNKLSIRRPQVKCTTDICRGVNTIQNGSTSSYLADFEEFLAAEQANSTDPPENSSSLLEWDFPEVEGYGVAVNDANDATGDSYQWNNPEGGNFDDAEYEPQTYFSFTELLAAEDSQLDNGCDGPMPGYEHPQTDFHEFATTFQEASHGAEEAKRLACDICCIYILTVRLGRERGAFWVYKLEVRTSEADVAQIRESIAPGNPPVSLGAPSRRPHHRSRGARVVAASAAAEEAPPPPPPRWAGKLLEEALFTIAEVAAAHDLGEAELGGGGERW
uniref:DDT domain-containing protein n=1 Tax=Ananas comosus var. bracteatus TaxID=296719 RepID=A0A6V7QWP2_ANACO